MNIKDAYIHNGLGVLRELQVTAAGMLQLKRAAKDSNDAYVGWEDVYNLTNIKPTNAGTADNVPWTGITGKPDTFPVATHDHDDRYLKLAGNTTSAPVTGPIYIDGPGLFIRSKDATKNIWEIVGDGTAWTSNYGFYLQYYGAGSGNNNDLILFSHGQASTDVEVYRVHQDGSFVFKSVPKVGTNNIYHAGNLTIGTLMGSTAVGDSDEPVYWNGTAFVKANAYPTKASWNYDDVYLKLSGGNLTGKLTIKTNNFGNQLTLDRGADGGSWGPSITFYNNGTFLASLGVDTSGTLYKGDNGNTKYAIYHAGNLTPKTITLSTSAQTYITAGSTNYTLQMPSTDPYTSARTPSAHDHERIKPTRHDSDDPAPNTKGAYLTFQFSYIGGHWWNVLNMRSYTDMKYVSAELLTPANNPGADTGYSGNMMWRQGRNSTWLDMRTILDSANYTDYTVKKDGTGATGTWGIDISGNAATATTATNSDKVDELHAMSAGSLLYKYAVTATIPASSVTGDFWYATITFARSYVRELTRSMLDATYSNYQGQVYLNTYEYNGAWYAFTTNYNGSNIKGIAHKSQNNPIYYVKLAKPVTYNNTVPDGTITVYSPYNCTITVSATAPSGVTFTSLTTPGFTNLKASSAYSADSATTATYASNVGAAGTAGTNYVAASKVIAACNWYDTMTGSDTDTVINRWSEIVDFVANFEETPDLATYLSNNYLAKSGGTMTGQLKWNNSNALPEQISPQYFLCIDAFNSGGTTKWASKANTLKALTGLTSTAIGDSDEPVYWDGSKFVKAGAYPTKASWDYDDVYPKKYSYSLPPQKCVKITYSNSAPVLISADRSNGQAQFLLAGLGYGADGWIRNQFRCLIPSTFFSWKLSDTACTVELYHNTTNSGNAVVTVITTGSITFTETDALSGDADTKRFACYDELTWGNISGKPDSFTPAAHTHYIGTTATQNSSAAQDLTGIKDSTFSGVMNITGKADSYTQGIRIHDAAASGTHAISSIWLRAGAATGFTAGMQGITADSTGMRFRLAASASGTTPTDYLTIAYGGAVTVASKFTASSSVYFTGLSEGTSDPTDGTEILTSYATNNGFADTSGAGQVYRRKASTLYNYIKGKTDNLYVKLSSTEQTIESTISSFSKGIVEFYRSSGDHIAFITFSNKVNNAKRVLGSIGFYSGGVGKLQYRSADAKFYDIVNGSNITTYIVGTASTTLSTSEQTLLTIKSGESGSLSSTTVKVKLPATDPYTSARTPTAHTHYATTFKDSRNEAMTPTQGVAVNGVAIDFKTKANGVGAGSGAYCGLVTFDPYSDVSGGYPLQMGFNSGVDASNTNELYIRTAKTADTWNAWRTVITSSNITTYINDCRNNIVDLRANPQTFNPSYLKDIVFISEADYTTLVSNGSITKNSITHTYNASNWYVIEDKVPEYAENAGNADYASNAGHAGTAEWANNVDWDDIDNKPSWANSSLAWSDVTGKPTWVTWSETSSNATYSLSNATWTQTITLPTAAGSYILKLVSGNSTLTGVFSVGASDNAKDEISLHLHGNGPRLYARTNGTKLELSRNVATATNTSVTITYRRMI